MMCAFPLLVALALLLGLLMAYADSRTIHSASAKAEFTRREESRCALIALRSVRLERA